MKWQFIQLIFRCILNLLGLWVASKVLSGLDYNDQWITLIIASIILSLVNALIKPFVMILSLPALLLSLGVFTLIINGAMLYIVHLVYKPFEINSFSTAILAGIIIGLINYILTRVIDLLQAESV
jgi:putative membrane protein